MKTFKRLILLSLVAFGLLACGSSQKAGQDHAANDPERITIDQVLTKMERGEPITFLDSRNDHAWSQAGDKIPGAIRVSNNGHLQQLIKELPKNRFIVTYCT